MAIDSRRCIALGCLVAGLAVVLGAFGAHALEERLVADGQLANWETAVRYQAWHGLALVAYGLFRERRPDGGWFVAWAFALGALLFSGSILALALGAPSKFLWPLTPLGGLGLIAGWLLFALQALRRA